MECSICLEPIAKDISFNSNIIALPCGHMLHRECNNDLLFSNCPTKDKCPICRTSIVARDNWSNNDNIPLPIVQALLFSLPRVENPS